MEDAKNKLKRSVRMKNLAQEINDFSANSNSLVTTTSSVLKSPTNIVFSASANSTTSLTISWTAPAATSSALQVSRYIIERSFDNFQTSTTSQLSNTFITIQNLNPDFTYQFKIRAQNDVLVNGKPTLSPISNTFTTSTKWLLESPKNFTLVSKFDLTNTVILKWDALVFTTVNADDELEGYEINWSGQISYPNIPPYVVNNNKKVSSTITDTSILELYPGIDYTFKVRAFNKSGVTTSFSNAVVVRIEPIINPPTDLDVIFRSYAGESKQVPRAVVNWTPPVTNYKIDAYEVYWYDCSVDWNNNNYTKYSLQYKYVPNNNNITTVNLDDFINFYTEIKVKSYTFRLRAVSFIPTFDNKYNVYLPDGFTGIISLNSGGVDYYPLYRQIIVNSTMPPNSPSCDNALQLNVDPPRVTGIGIEVITFRRAIMKWTRPDTFQPFNEYYVSASLNSNFPSGESGTSEITLSSSTTSTTWTNLVNLEGNVTYYFRVGVKNIYDNVINWSTVAAVMTPTPIKPETFSSQLIHHSLTFDEDDNCFNVTVNSPTSYNVEILRPIEIVHDVSIPERWGGNIKITVDKDWNINMSFNTPDGWIQNNQWIYGRLVFISGDVTTESTASVQNESNYLRRVFHTNDAKYEHFNSNEYIVAQLCAFRERDGNKNFSKGISSGPGPTLKKIFTGSNPPKRDKDDQYYVNNPNNNSIYVLRYQAFIQGYYAGSPTNDMMILLSGDIEVKLPGFQKSDPGYYYLLGTKPTQQKSIESNGIGLVYRRSDCGYPNVRVYGCGGTCGGSTCGRWLSSSYANARYGTYGIEKFNQLDVVWYADGPPGYVDKNGQVYFERAKKKINTLLVNRWNDYPRGENPPPQRNWRFDEIQNVIYNCWNEDFFKDDDCRFDSDPTKPINNP